MTEESEASEPYGRYRQTEVYTAGRVGIEPTVPVAYEDLAAEATAAMDDAAAAYVSGGAGEGRTTRDNRRAFDRWWLRPRMLRDVEHRDLRVELFGETLPVPVLLAPVGAQGILHEDGEVATARAAASVGVPTVLSSVSSETMEDVAAALGDGPDWFQLYWPADPALADSLLERAEDAGFDAVVVTVDTPLPGWREGALQEAYLPFLDAEGVANYFADPVFRAGLDQPPEENPDLAVQAFLDVFSDSSHTWDDLAGLVERTDLPVVVKGVLHPADARAAVDAGARGVVVSNHGGRQVDGAIPAVAALPDVVDAVGDDAAVLVDSGVRRGSDALKAIALGAEAVLLGRPFLYGLALAGSEGVEAVLKNVLADLDLTLGLTGYDAVRDVGRECLVENPGFG